MNPRGLPTACGFRQPVIQGVMFKELGALPLATLGRDEEGIPGGVATPTVRRQRILPIRKDGQALRNPQRTATCLTRSLSADATAPNWIKPMKVQIAIEVKVDVALVIAALADLSLTIAYIFRYL